MYSSFERFAHTARLSPSLQRVLRPSGSIVVRDASIGTDQLGKYLYVVNDSNRVEYRRISAGSLVDDTLRLVTEGLEPYEKYVTKALLKVRNGMSVVPVMEKQ